MRRAVPALASLSYYECLLTACLRGHPSPTACLQLCSKLNTPAVSYVSSTENDDREQHLQRRRLALLPK